MSEIIGAVAAIIISFLLFAPSISSLRIKQKKPPFTRRIDRTFKSGREWGAVGGIFGGAFGLYSEPVTTTAGAIIGAAVLGTVGMFYGFFTPEKEEGTVIKVAPEKNE